MKPRVSILLPAFDAEATLSSCLRSILRQSETRWECIVVDDGSRDATAAVARTFAEADPRFRVVTTEHRGLVAALEAGLVCCRADLVARMDADDWMHRDRLRDQTAALDAQPALAAVGAHVRLFPRRHLGVGMRRYEAWLAGIETPRDVIREAFVECPVAHPTLVIRRDVLTEFGYRDCGWPEDYDLILRLLGAGESVAVVPRRLLAWRNGPRRLSRIGAAYRLERFTECKAEYLARSLLAGSDRYVLWGYGGTGRKLSRALHSLGHRPSHIVELHPRRIGQRIHGAAVISPAALGALPRRPVVVSVAGLDARTRIRAFLGQLGMRETVDFVCAA